MGFTETSVDDDNGENLNNENLNNARVHGSNGMRRIMGEPFWRGSGTVVENDGGISDPVDGVFVSVENKNSYQWIRIMIAAFGIDVNLD